MICVVDPFPLHLFPANFSAVIPIARHHRTLCPMGPNHGDLFGGCAFRHKNFAANPGPGRIGGDAVACVAAAVLHHPLHSQLFAVGHEHSGPSVLIRQCGHEIIHLQKHILI